MDDITWDYEFTNINMGFESSGEKLTYECILSVIETEQIEWGSAWGCLFPNGSCILIQRGRSTAFEKIKYLKCSSNGITTLNVFSNKEELEKTLKREIFNRAGSSVVHYKFTGIFDITEVYEELLENMNIAYNEDLYQMRLCWNNS